MPIQPKQQPPYYQQGSTSTLIKLLATQTSTNPPSITTLLNTTPITLTPTYVDVGQYNLNFSSNQQINKILLNSSSGFGTLVWYDTTLIYGGGGTYITGILIQSWYLDTGSDILSNDLLTDYSLTIEIFT